MRWIDDVENVFRSSFYLKEAKVIFFMYVLNKRARDSWCEVVHDLNPDAVEFISWEVFVT